jgi:hypothetical protein
MIAPNANPTRNFQMNDKTKLIIASLLSIVFWALHWADDIVNGAGRA